jgi:hypothetical protein
MQPTLLSQRSFVQALSSAQSTGLPAWQAPAPLH